MPKTTKDAKATLLEFLDRAYNRSSWHGTNLRGSVRGLTPDEAAWRPGTGRHNVWELIVHCAYWKYAVRRRLTGQKRGSFALKGSNFFPRPEPGAATAKVLASDIALLKREHTLLRKAILAMSARQLTSSPAVLRRVVGIAAHDLYHAGQIQLLKRLQGKGGD